MLDPASLTDDELQSRRVFLEEVRENCTRELTVLNRETERRDWARHAQIQAAVAIAEARGQEVVHAIGDGVYAGVVA